MLPKEYLSRTTLPDAFTRRTKSGLWERIDSALRERWSIGVKRDATHSAAIIDSQSVTCADTVVAASSGYDVGKKSNLHFSQALRYAVTLCSPQST